MNIINDDFYITNMEITNNDDLRDKIHEIHNYMRNDLNIYKNDLRVLFNSLNHYNEIIEIEISL